MKVGTSHLPKCSRVPALRGESGAAAAGREHAKPPRHAITHKHTTRTPQVNLALKDLPTFKCLPQRVGQHNTTTHLLPDESEVIDVITQVGLCASDGAGSDAWQARRSRPCLLFHLSAARAAVCRSRSRPGSSACFEMQFVSTDDGRSSSAAHHPPNAYNPHPRQGFQDVQEGRLPEFPTSERPPAGCSPAAARGLHPNPCSPPAGWVVFHTATYLIPPCRCSCGQSLALMLPNNSLTNAIPPLWQLSGTSILQWTPACRWGLAEWQTWSTCGRTPQQRVACGVCITWAQWQCTAAFPPPKHTRTRARTHGCNRTTAATIAARCLCSGCPTS